MKSLLKKIMINFVLIIILTVTLMEIFIIDITKNNNYNALENNLNNQIRLSAELYKKYFNNSSLEENVENNIDTFWRHTTAEVQIVDKTGKILMDSLGVVHTELLNTSDFKEALAGKQGVFRGSVDYDSQRVMAVSVPLMSNNEIVGILRFVCSLKNVEDDTTRVIIVYLLVGLGIIIISLFISLILSRTIVYPIQEITSVAEKISTGNLDVRSHIKTSDEIGKLSNTLNTMAEELKTREKMKNDFISSVSHELRTPLTSIKGWAITLLDEKFEDKKLIYEGLRIIDKETDRLSSLVEDLLDFSRVLSKKLCLKKESINIKALMREIAMQNIPLMGSARIKFSLKCEDQLPNLVSDSNRLKQVFINILDNAIKFTPVGGKIGFYAKKENDRIKIEIKDSGCGISNEELPRVKEKFFKGSGSNSGSGIGLSVCDEIVNQMGGEMLIESQINMGTTVTISFPILLL